MTEVFDAWAAERLQKPALPYAQPYPQPIPYAQQHPYAPQPQYPQSQPWLQAPQQQPYQQVKAGYGYNYNSPAQLPAQLAGTPIASPMPSPAPSYASPAPSYASPAPHNALPYGYAPPQGGAVEMPAELPGGTLLAAPAAAPIPVVSTDVSLSSSSVARLARDLWGADAVLEEEEVAV
jgi:hypothetical protein